MNKRECLRSNLLRAILRALKLDERNNKAFYTESLTSTYLNEKNALSNTMFSLKKPTTYIFDNKWLKFRT